MVPLSQLDQRAFASTGTTSTGTASCSTDEANVQLQGTPICNELTLLQADLQRICNTLSVLVQIRDLSRAAAICTYYSKSGAVSAAC